jgi:hypothetical protein
MYTPSKKTVATLTVFTLLGAGVGAGSTYYLTNDNNASQTPNAQLNQPEKTASPNLEATLPTGTLSPTVITADPVAYTDKDVKARGQIIEVTPGKFAVVGQEKTKPGGIELDFTGSKLDPKQYLSAQDRSGDAVTVNGKIFSDNKSLKLTVKSIEK